METIEIKYSCEYCGVQDAAVQTPTRMEEVPVETWMNTMILFLAADHKRRSPACFSVKLAAVKIPMGGRRWVGGPVIN
jgi:hypothetical protein